MNLSKVLTALLLAAIIAVGVDALISSYKNHRASQIHLNEMLDVAIKQAKTIADQAYVRQLNAVFYKQAQVDYYITTEFGTEAIQEMKKVENYYLTGCIPSFGELECRKKWYSSSVQRTREMLDDKYNKRNLTPVST